MEFEYIVVYWNLWQAVDDVGAGGVVIGRGAWQGHLQWEGQPWIFLDGNLNFSKNFRAGIMRDMIIITWISMSGSSMIQLSTTSSFTTWKKGVIINHVIIITIIISIITMSSSSSLSYVPGVVQTLQRIGGRPPDVVLPPQSFPGSAFLRLCHTVLDHIGHIIFEKKLLLCTIHNFVKKISCTHWCCHTSEWQCIAVLLQSQDPWNKKKVWKRHKIF